MKANIMLLVVVFLAGLVFIEADPCGMVAPTSSGRGIVRLGVQTTYAFYKNGIESLVIRPGFSGKVENFGMLIPFPTPPAIRKVEDDIFPHIASAVDPPELRLFIRKRSILELLPHLSGVQEKGSNSGLRHDQVRVLREETVGIYDVAVIDAGSALALKRWMVGRGYKYPEGMEDACNDYIVQGWCFVAAKIDVGRQQEVRPQANRLRLESRIPAGASFGGYVQGMAFRFRSDKLVIPMRLSVFNSRSLRNIVYILSDEPQKIRGLPEDFVVRQIDGQKLYRNLQQVPVRLIGGTLRDLSARQMKMFEKKRSPTPYNGLARDLFAADLLAASAGKIRLAHEQKGVHDLQRETAFTKALEQLKSMTMTVVDGDFPRYFLAHNNLTFEKYHMPQQYNDYYNYEANRALVSMNREEAAGWGRRGYIYRGALYDMWQRMDVWNVLGFIIAIGFVLLATARMNADESGVKTTLLGMTILFSIAWNAFGFLWALLIIASVAYWDLRQNPLHAALCTALIWFSAIWYLAGLLLASIFLAFRLYRFVAKHLQPQQAEAVAR